MRHSMSVRRCTYRGVQGWQLVGRRAGSGFSMSCFFEHESAARRTFRRMVDDPSYEFTLRDFEP